MKMLLSDDVHVHARNFRSLFSFIETTRQEVRTLSLGRDLWNRYGDYSDVDRVRQREQDLPRNSPEELRQLTGKAAGLMFNAFDIARSEILSFVLATQENWHRGPVSNCSDFIFEKMHRENPDVLRLNLAAVLEWCDIYSEELKDIASYEAAVVFSGSQIYQRLLLGVCSGKQTRALVIESFQTGNEFHFEERYTPLGAGSDIRFPSVASSLRLPEGRTEREIEIGKARTKFLKGKNKNVVQPPPNGEPLPAFPNSAKTVLLAAQVQNDFSLVESQLQDLNPLENYRKLIDGILERTDFNIVVKTHPWERQKTHLNKPFTYEHLSAHVAAKDRAEQQRVRIVEDGNIVELLTSSDYFVTLTSQSAFEACFYSGLRPFVLGFPFFAGAGFTNDFSSVDDMVESLTATSGELSLSGYDAFMEFLAKLIQLHLVSTDDASLPAIASRLFGRKVTSVQPAASYLRDKALIEANSKIRSSGKFRYYAAIYGPFLSTDERAELRETPVSFFQGRRTPVARIGRSMFRRTVKSVPT